jgi:S1-C subfamily serine protease
MGDWCFTMGAPLGLSFSFQEGYLVAERQVGGQPYYQLSVWAAPGSSGSPVLNRTGQLMGMITEVAELASSELGIAFALPATKIQQAYERYLTFALYDTARTN